MTPLSISLRARLDYCHVLMAMCSGTAPKHPIRPRTSLTSFLNFLPNEPWSAYLSISECASVANVQRTIEEFSEFWGLPDCTCSAKTWNPRLLPCETWEKIQLCGGFQLKCFQNIHSLALIRVIMGRFYQFPSRDDLLCTWGQFIAGTNVNGLTSARLIYSLTSCLHH